MTVTIMHDESIKAKIRQIVIELGITAQHIWVDKAKSDAPEDASVMVREYADRLPQSKLLEIVGDVHTTPEYLSINLASRELTVIDLLRSLLCELIIDCAVEMYPEPISRTA